MFVLDQHFIPLILQQFAKDFGNFRAFFVVGFFLLLFYTFLDLVEVRLSTLGSAYQISMKPHEVLHLKDFRKL